MTKSYKDNIEVELQAGDREIIFELEFKTPVVYIHSDSIGLTTKFKEFIESLEDSVKKNMADNSEKLFNGKTFTYERISSSFDSCISEDKVLLDTSSVKWFDPNGKKCAPGTAGTAIVKVNRVKFNGRFSLDLSLLKVKEARKNEKIDFFNSEPDSIPCQEVPEIQEVLDTSEQDFW